jgi:L-alanine-DL-glutamate epimerase-like enolase superfamily enzyme
MKVTDIRTMRLEGPDPQGIGGQARTCSFLLVRVDTDAGVFGIGEAADFAGVREIIALCREWLVGRDPLAIGPFVRGFLYGALPGPGPLPAQSIMSATATTTGPVSWAIAGVEMALWDVMGRALGVPSHTLLGGAYRDRVRVYLDRSGVADVADLGAWRGLGERAVAEGFDWIKFDLEQITPELTADPWNRSISGRQLDLVAERLGAVRAAVGHGIDVALDGHMCFDVETAVRVARALEPLGLRWFEDPVPITSAASLARVREESPIPIAAGEMFTTEQFRLFVEAGALDILHPDVLFVGGLGEAQRAASLGDLHYLPVAFHDNGGAVTRSPRPTSRRRSRTSWAWSTTSTTRPGWASSPAATSLCSATGPSP